MVVAEAGQRAAHPDEEERNARTLEDKPEDGEDGGEDGSAEVCREEMTEGAGGSAEEEEAGDAAYGDHVGVLGHEEHGELHGAVLGVVAGDEFGFGLGRSKGARLVSA